MNYSTLAVISILLLIAIYLLVIYIELKKDLKETTKYIAKKEKDFLKLENGINQNLKELKKTERDFIDLYNKTIDVHKDMLTINRENVEKICNQEEQSA